LAAERYAAAKKTAGVPSPIASATAIAITVIGCSEPR
jgi:hypothetical protein